LDGHRRQAEFRGLHLWTLVACVGGVLLWNFSFYRQDDLLSAGEPRGVPPAGVEGGADPQLAAGSTAGGMDLELMRPPLLDAPLSLDGVGDSPEERQGAQPDPDDAQRTRGAQSARIATGSAGEPGQLVEHLDPLRFVRGWVIDDLRTGLWETSYEGGEPRSSGHYSNDLRDGNWSFWAPSGGLVLNGDYRDGKREGVWNGWHPNGARRSQQSFSDGQLGGNWVLWFSTGQIKERGQYVRGLREGSWEFFDIQGNTDLRTGLYRNGRRISD